MKSLQFFTLLFLVIVVSACNGDEIERLEKANQALLQSKASQDSVLGGYMSAFTTFDENLEAIKARENIISQQTFSGESEEMSREKVLNDISLINDLLAQNRQIIDDLNSRLARNEGDQSQLRKLISRLESQLVERDQEIAALKVNLEEMNFTAESLNRRLDTMVYAREQLVHLTSGQRVRMTAQDSALADQQGLIEIQTKTMNTGFYVVGTAKDLKEQNVITKEGGFVGIGGSKVLRPDFNQDVFTQVDITETEQINFEHKKVRVVTYHPSDTYVLKETDNTITSLEITDPKRFWEVSKYLVVVTD